MSDYTATKPFNARLMTCCLLILAAGGYFVWSAFTYGESAGIVYAVLLIPTAIGVAFRQIWAQYFVFSYAAMWTVAWCIETPPYIWTHEQDLRSTISLFISLIPIAFMLIVSWNAYRGFQS